MECSPLQVDINLQTNERDELVVTLDLLNRSGEDLHDWSLQFDLPKPITAGHRTHLLSQIGSHVRLAPAESAVLPANASHSLQFTGHPAIIRRISDLPSGIYVNTGDRNLSTTLGAHNLIQVDLDETRADAGSAPTGYSQSLTDAGLVAAGEFTTCARNPVPVIPRPRQSKRLTGVFHYSGPLSYWAEPGAEDAIDWLSGLFPSALEPVPAPHRDAAQLRFISGGTSAPGAYEIEVSPVHIDVRGGDPAGFLYAGATLVQQLALECDGPAQLPCAHIVDEPRFAYRGLMLDCARHFHRREVIFKLLDLMALYKLNYFHWHLTDDEGWRIEIEAYPELTRVGAWRGAEEVLEPQFGSGPDRYGGYYTREDVRAVVAYARARQITVIPEIDIPGHSRAALKSLPELLVEEADRSTYCSAQLYSDNVLNPALPGTYEFLHKVLDEVCELFPGPYVHLGADEVPSGVWLQSPACQALMRAEGYETAWDLQGHLLRNLQSYLAGKGRVLLGWEEAAHGDKLDHSAIICAWSGIASAAQTAALGHRVIACPAPFAYLDLAWDDSIEEPGFHWAGTANLETCYAYEPEAHGQGADFAQQLLGIQSLLWSELVASPERLDYMLFPRMLAIAEVAWSPRGSKDWDDFQSRVSSQHTLLDNSRLRVHTGIAAAGEAGE